MRQLRFVSLLFFITLSLTTLGGSQTVTLKIIETTDEHGAIFPYDFINDRGTTGSLAQVQTYVQQERQNPDQQVLLLSGGDILQGQPAVYYFNFEKTNVPHLYARVMNYMGYDAGAVGNHDIETGHAVYDKFALQLDLPWLAANAVRTDNGEPYFPPYTVFERKGVKIAILGMITPGIPDWLPPGIWSGMKFDDMIETARKWVPLIQEREHPDLLLGLFHSGVDFTYGGQTAETPRNENAARLVAEQVSGFDIIFVGHDHRGWNFTTTNPDGDSVSVLGASSHARDVAAATVMLTYDPDSGIWHKQISGEIVDMAKFAPDSTFMATFAPDFEEIKAYVSRPIGRFTKAISTREAMFGNSAFVDLIHQIQLELTGAEISVAAPLSFDATIEKGQVFVRDMFNLYKFENLLYTLELTGQEVKDFLTYSYSGWFDQMQNPEDHLLKFVRDKNGAIQYSKRTNSPRLHGAYFNFDSMAGIRYTVDVSMPANERITISALADGEPFELSKKYKIAINSYRGNGGGGHLTAGAHIPKEELPNRIISSTEKDLRYFMMKWIEKKKVVTPVAFGNWQVVPGDWWRAAKQRDYQLLYGSQRLN